MEEKSNRGERNPPLLDLIRNERKEWVVRAQASANALLRVEKQQEEQQLELRLGLPGGRGEGHEKMECTSSALSLGLFPRPPKRGFMDTVDKEGYGNQEQQQKAALGKELSLGPSGNSSGTGIKAEEKQRVAVVAGGCCPPTSHAVATTNTTTNSSSCCSRKQQARSSAAPVVGWPPVRTFRKNIASSSSKQSPEPGNESEHDKVKQLAPKKSHLVKINMDGVLIGRKVDLAAYDSYEGLTLAAKDLFQGLIEAQKGPADEKERRGDEEEDIFSKLLDGTGKYTLVYEDSEGDKLLVGDVPWNVFVDAAKRLRVLRSSELPLGMLEARSKP